MRCDNFLEAHISDRCGVKVQRWRLRGCSGTKEGCEGLIPAGPGLGLAGEGRAGQPLEAALKAGDPPGASCLHLHSLRAHPGCRPCSGFTQEQGGGAGPGWAQQAGAGGHLQNQHGPASNESSPSAPEAVLSVASARTLPQTWRGQGAGGGSRPASL